MKISIIVPVYNVENYISECIESILNQTYKDFELILVDDGSLDNSGKICDEYSKKDKRIFVIHIKNSGVANARNIALENCHGEYIIFIDSDDYIENNYIANMIPQNSDMNVCSYTEIYKCKTMNKIIKCNNKYINNKELIQLVFDNICCGGFLWNKIFKTEIVRENNIKFNSEILMYSDIPFVIEYITYIQKIEILEQTLYNYRMRRGSIVRSTGKNKVKTKFDSYGSIIKVLEKNSISTDPIMYQLYIEICKNIKYFNKKEFINKYDVNLNNILIKILFSKKISTNRKLKLLIKTKLSWIYKIYIKNKIKTNELYN